MDRLPFADIANIDEILQSFSIWEKDTETLREETAKTKASANQSAKALADAQAKLAEALSDTEILKSALLAQQSVSAKIAETNARSISLQELILDLQQVIAENEGACERERESNIAEFARLLKQVGRDCGNWTADLSLLVEVKLEALGASLSTLETTALRRFKHAVAQLQARHEARLGKLVAMHDEETKKLRAELAEQTAMASRPASSALVDAFREKEQSMKRTHSAEVKELKDELDKLRLQLDLAQADVDQTQAKLEQAEARLRDTPTPSTATQSTVNSSISSKLSGTVGRIIGSMQPSQAAAGRRPLFNVPTAPKRFRPDNNN